MSSSVAVITGAGSGIGAALARRAARNGMRVVVADVDAAAAERVADETGGLAVVTDVRDPLAVEALADRAYASFGRVDLLVNNAGIEQFGPLWDTPLANWQRMLDVNLSGVFHGIRSFVPRMIADGRPAELWNTASLAAIMSVPNQAAYTATKHAVLGLSETLQLELAEGGHAIQVRVILPAAVATGILDSAGIVDRGDIAAAERVRASMRKLSRSAMGADETAAAIFAQATAGRFHLTPQPRIADRMARQRARRLRGWLPPAPPRAKRAEDWGR